MNMRDFFLKVKSYFVEKPTRKLMWTNEDYNLGMKWAKTQPHPFMKNKTLWDLCYDRHESVNSIDNLNKFLFNEI